MDDGVPGHRDSHASSSHEVSLEPTCKRREVLGKHSVKKLISLKTEIARFVRGPKLQGPRAEGAMAKAVPRAENFGDLITADHQSSQ